MSYTSIKQINIEEPKKIKFKVEIEIEPSTSFGVYADELSDLAEKATGQNKASFDVLLHHLSNIIRKQG